MKNLLKISIFLALFTFTVSCGDDDSETPSNELQNAEFAFDATKTPVTVPTAISESNDLNVQQIASYMALANGLQTWSSFLTVPDGATQSTTPIGRKVSVNGRTQEDVLVYTWSYDDGVESFTIAYQVGETDDKYTFEVFWKFDGGEFQRFIYAEESKGELREGRMDLFIDGFFDDVPSGDPLVTYTWRETATGQFFFEATIGSSLDSTRISLVVNADQSGSIEVFSGDNKIYEATWTADGLSGTYTFFNLDGTIESSGTWS